VKILPVVAAVAALAIGCGREAPLPSLAVAKVADLVEVNTSGGFVDSVALAPDGSLVATGQRNGPIRLWAAADPKEPIALDGQRQAVVDLAFAPNGRMLASLGRHKESALRFWQPDERTSGKTWIEATAVPVGRCLALRFDGAGTLLAVMCDREVLLVDVATRRESSRLSNPHKEELKAFDLTPDGSKLVTAGHEGDVTVWDALAATPIRTFSVARSRRPGRLPQGMPAPEVFAVVVALSPDGARAAAVTIEGTVYVWETATGAELLSEADAEAGGPPTGSLRFAKDGQLLAPRGDRYGMRLIDVARKTSRKVTAGGKAYHTVAITNDATAYAAVTSVVAGGRLSYDVEIWKIE